MKTFSKTLLFLVMLSLFCNIAKAQDYDSFFRGEVAPEYEFLFNGTYFWNDNLFKEGCTLYYDGKEYTNLTMNVDANLQQVLIRREGDAVPMTTQRDKVYWFKMQDTLYVNLNKMGYEDMPVGFYSVLHNDGSVLFKHVQKLRKSSVDNVNGAVIGYYDPHYKEKVITHFSKETTYWHFLNGKFTQISTKKDLKALYPDKKKELNQVGKTIAPSFRSAHKDSYLTRIVSVLDPSTGEVDLINAPAFHVERAAEDNSQYLESKNESIASTKMITGLPEGWLSLGADDNEGDVVGFVSGSITKAIHSSKTYELGDKTKGKTGRVQIEGYVRNLMNGEPVIEATIYDDKTKDFVRTDKNGHYKVTLPVGENVLHFSEYAMEDFNVKVVVYDQAQLDVEMKEKTETLESAMISANSRANHKTAKMGVEKISVSNVKKFPTAFGEGDVLKAVQTLPGVKSVGEASDGINVRGGSTDQNLILYNESTIYNPNHMFGMFSAFDSDLVETMELYKSSIPAEYGGRISSVLDVDGKEGNMKKFQGAAGIGLLTSHAYIEGPLKQDKTSFILGGRTTYSNWILKNLPENSGYANGKANFSDVSLGMTHKFSQDNTLQFNTYWSQDEFAFSGDTTFHYSNLNVVLKWKKKYSQRSSFELTGGYDWYTALAEDNSNIYDGYTLESIINQGHMKAAFKTVYGNHTLSYGAQAVLYALDRGNLYSLGEESTIIPKSLGTEMAIEPSAWLADSWQMNDKVMFDYGARLSSFMAFDSKKVYAAPEIRLSGKYTVNPDFSIKAGFNTMDQYIHMISNTTTVSPMNTWKLSDDEIKPQTGWQAAAGGYWSVFKSTIDISLETYYKRMNNYLDYKSGATLVMNESLFDDLIETTGKAYGIEFMVKKPFGNFNGWISYTYSRTFLKEMMDRGVATINGGNWYPAAYDKPHDFKFVGNYKVTHRYSFSFNVDYSTGRPVTIPVGRYYYGGGYRLAYSDRNGYRIPDYFRLDLALNVEPGHYLKKLTHFSFTFGVYNVTGRKNAYSVYYSTNGGQRLTGHMISVFATQIPYVNINLKF